MKNIIILILAVTFFISCSESNKTDGNKTKIEQECDLNILNLKGKVQKLEIITQTTIPISEWLYTNVDGESFNRICRQDALYSFIGNSILYFDNSGNLPLIIFILVINSFNSGMLTLI